jgi:hypothetical protein
VSVMIDEHHSDEVTNFIHAWPDCVIHPFSNHRLYCNKCLCCKCQKPASKCHWWVKHCSLTGVTGFTATNAFAASARSPPQSAVGGWSIALWQVSVPGIK